MKIIYLGYTRPHSTARHRADALARIGCEVTILDLSTAVHPVIRHPFLGRFHYHTGYRYLQRRIGKWLDEVSPRFSSTDLLWVDGGDLVGPECLRRFTGLQKVLYNVDDPTGERDGKKFEQTIKSLPLYDLCVTVRKETEQEMRSLGAKQVLRLWRSYDEIAHAPFARVEDIPAALRSEVAFIGTWMRNEGRDQFLRELGKAGVPISIWGDRWPKSPLWGEIQKYWRSGELRGRDYVGAIQGARICIGMLSKGNRDLHTHRSLEIPYAGGVFCAERTSEHLELYREGEDAVFWSSPEECAQKCLELLADEERRVRIRDSGMRRVRELHVGNEDICRAVLAAIS